MGSGELAQRRAVRECLSFFQASDLPFGQSVDVRLLEPTFLAERADGSSILNCFPPALHLMLSSNVRVGMNTDAS
jgi:hypothetical protein